MTDREELLRVATALWAQPEFEAPDEAVFCAERLIQAVNAKCAEQPQTIRVKPEPVAWRDSSGSLWFGPGPRRIPLYEPEDA